MSFKHDQTTHVRLLAKAFQRRCCGLTLGRVLSAILSRRVTILRMKWGLGTGGLFEKSRSGILETFYMYTRTT